MTEIKKNVKLSCAVAIFNLGFVIQLVPQFCLFVCFFLINFVCVWRSNIRDISVQIIFVFICV
jgi:hypothetical protein